VTTTIVGINHVGPSFERVTGPPASRKISGPWWKLRAAFTRVMKGSGFLGTSGNVPGLALVVVTAMFGPSYINCVKTVRRIGAPSFFELSVALFDGRASSS
jgi:hypothetical protein